MFWSKVRVLLVVGMALICSGCGILVQSVMGWSEESSVTQSRTHSVALSSEPPGAQLERKGPDGKLADLGVAPFNDSLSYEQKIVTESPKAMGLVIGGLVELGVAVACIVAAGGSEESTDIYSSAEDTGGSVALYAMGGTMVYFGLQDLVIALIYGATGDHVKSKTTVGSPKYFYTANLEGFPSATQAVNIPDQSAAKFVMGGESSVVASASPPTKTDSPTTTMRPPTGNVPKGASKKWVIAVMNVEDVNAKNRSQAIDRDLVRNVGDQLRIFIAQQGFRTIDRGAQERAFKEQIANAKSDSYKACVDDNCQIELGKALASSHILRARITRFGSRCVLNGELIDLRSEVTVAAASSRGDCQAEGFLSMSEEVAQNLLR